MIQYKLALSESEAEAEEPTNDDTDLYYMGIALACGRYKARSDWLTARSERSLCNLIILLAPRAGKMNQTRAEKAYKRPDQTLRCDWLPERARWSYLARSGLPAVSRKKNFPESHIMNPLLTKLVRSR